MTLQIDGKRLSEDERLTFLANLEHTGEFNELCPLSYLPLASAQVASANGESAFEAIAEKNHRGVQEHGSVEEMEAVGAVT